MNYLQYILIYHYRQQQYAEVHTPQTRTINSFGIWYRILCSKGFVSYEPISHNKNYLELSERVHPTNNDNTHIETHENEIEFYANVVSLTTVLHDKE